MLSFKIERGGGKKVPGKRWESRAVAAAAAAVWQAPSVLSSGCERGWDQASLCIDLEASESRQ